VIATCFDMSPFSKDTDGTNKRSAGKLENDRSTFFVELLCAGKRLRVDISSNYVEPQASGSLVCWFRELRSALQVTCDVSLTAWSNVLSRPAR
jgi:hypothetical protein